MSAKNWCFTVNGDEAKLAEWHKHMSETPVMPEDPVAPETKTKIRFLQYQFEEGSQLHAQGYIQVVDKSRMTTIKRILGGHIISPHVEIANGTPEDNIAYTSKEESRFVSDLLPMTITRGTPIGAGQRKDLEEIAFALSSGNMTMNQIAQSNPAQFVRFHRGLKALLDETTPPYTGGVKTVKVFYGPTGTGKTKTAYETYPGAYFWGPEQGKWFERYCGEKTTILDEYRGQLPLGFLLRLTDRYPMKIELKGSSTEFVSDTIVICSPVHPLLWYTSLNQNEGKMDQLMRRITEVKWFGGDLPEPPIPTVVVQPIQFPQFV